MIFLFLFLLLRGKISECAHCSYAETYTVYVTYCIASVIGYVLVCQFMFILAFFRALMPHLHTEITAWFCANQ